MLKRSERNGIIEDFRNGIINPEYEVKATKTKGRYTVRKRKVPLTDEQMEELGGGEQSAEPKVSAQLPPMSTPPMAPSMKRSKKENALFELQNQLNSQMLSQITELTNKVAKLKAWKKAVKKEMYEDVEEASTVVQPPTESQVEPSLESQVEPSTESPVEQPPTETSMVQQDYMSQIPQQYLQQGYEAQYVDPPQPTFDEPAYYPSTRNSIDYSKFGF